MKKKIVISILILMLVFSIVLGVSACGRREPANELLEVRVYVRPEDGRKAAFTYTEQGPLTASNKSELYRDSSIGNEVFDPFILGENRSAGGYNYAHFMGNSMLGGYSEYDNNVLKAPNVGTYAAYTERYIANDLRKGTYQGAKENTVQYYSEGDTICFEAKIKTEKEYALGNFHWTLHTNSLSELVAPAVEQGNIQSNISKRDANGIQYVYAEYKVVNTPTYGLTDQQISTGEKVSRIVHKGFAIVLKGKIDSKVDSVFEAKDKNTIFKYRSKDAKNREVIEFEDTSVSDWQKPFFDRLIHHVLYDINVSDITTSSASVKVNVNDIDNVLSDTKSKVYLYAFYPRIYDGNYEYKTGQKINYMEFTTQNVITSLLYEFRENLVESDLLIKKVELQKGENDIKLTGLKSGYPVCLYVVEAYKTSTFKIKDNKDIVYKFPITDKFETKWLLDVAFEGEIVEHINEENSKISTADTSLKLDVNADVKITNASFKIKRFIDDRKERLGVEGETGDFYNQTIEQDNFTVTIAEDGKSVLLDMKGLLKDHKRFNKKRTLILIESSFDFEAIGDVEALEFGANKINGGETFSRNFDILFKW